MIEEEFAGTVKLTVSFHPDPDTGGTTPPWWVTAEATGKNLELPGEFEFTEHDFETAPEAIVAAKNIASAIRGGESHPRAIRWTISVPWEKWTAK